MTCIIASKDPVTEEVFLIGDSAGVDENGYGFSQRKDEKVFKNGPLFFGITDSFRMGQLLKYELQVPDSKPDPKKFNPASSDPAKVFLEEETHKWMCGPFIRAVRQCFEDHGFMKVYNLREFGGQFIVICNNIIFTIWSNIQVGYEYRLVSAVGCGAKYAIGAFLASIENTKTKTEIAIKVAHECSCGVSPPFIFYRINGEKYEKSIIVT